MLSTISGRSFFQNPAQLLSVIPRGAPLPHGSSSQYNVKREKCKVNDVIFPSGCEARAINLGNKNMKIGIIMQNHLFLCVNFYEETRLLLNNNNNLQNDVRKRDVIDKLNWKQGKRGDKW